MPGRQHAVLMRGAAVVADAAQPDHVAHHAAAQRFRHEAPRDAAGHSLRRARRRDAQPGAFAGRGLHPGAFAAQRRRRVVADRVVDGARDHLPGHDGRRHDPEQRQPGDEVGRSVDRVHHERQLCIGQAVQQAGIGGARLLADHQAAGEQPVQPGGDHHLRSLVRLGHQVGGAALLAHRARAQVAKTRHDLDAGGGAQQLHDFRPGGGVDHWCSNRARSAGSRRTRSRTASSASARSTTSPCWYSHAMRAPSAGAMA